MIQDLTERIEIQRFKTNQVEEELKHKLHDKKMERRKYDKFLHNDRERL